MKNILLLLLLLFIPLAYAEQFQTNISLVLTNTTYNLITESGSTSSVMPIINNTVNFDKNLNYTITISRECTINPLSDIKEYCRISGESCNLTRTLYNDSITRSNSIDGVQQNISIIAENMMNFVNQSKSYYNLYLICNANLTKYYDAIYSDIGYERNYCKNTDCDARVVAQSTITEDCNSKLVTCNTTNTDLTKQLSNWKLIAFIGFVVGFGIAYWYYVYRPKKKGTPRTPMEVESLVSPT